MASKRKSIAYFEIQNIRNDNEFLIIYNHVIDGMYILEKVFKKNHKIRKFDISEMWQYKFENGIAVFDSTKKTRILSTFLETDLNTIFKYAYNNWEKKYKPLQGINDFHFWSKKENFSLGQNEYGKWIWLENHFPCYTRNILDDIDL
jgi:hypothetical protein